MLRTCWVLLVLVLAGLLPMSRSDAQTNSERARREAAERTDLRCERGPHCPPAVAEAKKTAEAKKPPKRKMSRVAANWLLLLTTFWAYCGLAMVFGNTSARTLGFVLALLVLVPIGFIAGSGVASLFGGGRSGVAAGFGLLIGVPVALLWAFIASRVMAWVYGVLFGDSGLFSSMFRAPVRPRSEEAR